MNYDNQTATFDVNVTAVALTSISASFNQGATAIYESAALETLRPMLSVTAIYNDGHARSFVDYVLSGTLTEGMCTITATYGSLADTFSVNVTKVALVSISADYYPSMTIYEGDELSSLKPKLRVWGRNNDGSGFIIADGYTLAGTLTEETSAITVTYQGKTTTVNVIVAPVELTSITASFNQGATPVYESATLDSLKSMLTVTGSYNNGKTGSITGYALVGILTPGISAIIVICDNQTATFDVNVTAVTVIAFDHEQLLLCAGDRQQIRLTVTPSGMADTPIKWTSSDSSVAAVSAEGLVSAVGLGSATITAELRDAPSAAAACRVTVAQLGTMALPDGLAEIQEEAFMNTPFERIVAGENLLRIASKAFKNCASLKLVELGSSVTYIAEDAFEGCTGIVIVCPAGSAAENYARQHDFECYLR